MGGRLIRVALLASVVVGFGCQAETSAHTSKGKREVRRDKGNRDVRVDKGIGPIDLGDSYRQIRREMGRGRQQRWPAAHQVIVYYRRPSAGVTVYFAVRRDGRLRPGSQVSGVDTSSRAFRLPGGTSAATDFDAARAALRASGWHWLDCRARYGFAYLWHRGRRATTTLSYFPKPAGTILSIAPDPAPIEPPCSKLVFSGDFAP